MATQKPISTISYNTEAFLVEHLEAWRKAHIISAYQYICHKGEDGDKDHIHLRIEPNKKLDPMDLQEQLHEYQSGKSKPLGCRPFRPSKEEDWTLYAVHDKDYLALKYGGGEKGEKLPYTWQDIKAPEDYDTEVLYVRAKASMRHSTPNIATRLQSGETPLKLALEGENPYTLNALMHMLAKNDYQRIQNELLEVQERLDALENAVTRAGFAIVLDDSGQLAIERTQGAT